MNSSPLDTKKRLIFSQTFFQIIELPSHSEPQGVCICPLLVPLIGVQLAEVDLFYHALKVGYTFPSPEADLAPHSCLA